MFRKTHYSMLAVARRHPRLFAKLMKFAFIDFQRLHEEHFA
jgi:hypothetical protein